jgi:hypothetical protein
MTEPKITTTTLRDGTRIVEQRDGVQRAAWIYAPGNTGENADGQIYTLRRDSRVVAVFFATQGRKCITAGPMLPETKDGAFRTLRRWILAQVEG